MRAVVGTVNSSKPISLSKAAPVLSRFASSVASAGTRREVTAYLNRASAAFDELVQFHRDLRDELSRNSSNGVLHGEKERKKSRNKGDGDPKEVEVDGRENLEFSEEGNKKKRKSKKNRDRSESEIEIGCEGNRKEVKRENGVIDVDIDSKKKKKRDREDSENGVEGGGSEIHDRKKKRRKN